MEQMTGCKILDTYNTRMSLDSFAAMCRARQRRNRQKKAYWQQMGIGCAYPDCAGCAAGKRVARGDVPNEIRERLGGEMADTRKMGNCKNCEREMVLNTSGYCGSCSRAILGLTGEAKERALAIAREKYLGKGRMRSGVRGPIRLGRPEEPEMKKSGRAVVQGFAFCPGEPAATQSDHLPEFLQGIDLEKYRVVVILAR